MSKSSLEYHLKTHEADSRVSTVETDFDDNSVTKEVCDSPDGTTYDVINDINNMIGHEENEEPTLSHEENDKGAPETKCKICDKSFASITGFNHHMKNHELKKFSCMYCLKRFPTLDTLNQHIDGHDADETPKQFKCLQCDMKFKTKCHLYFCSHKI